MRRQRLAVSSTTARRTQRLPGAPVAAAAASPWRPFGSPPPTVMVDDVEYDAYLSGSSGGSSSSSSTRTAAADKAWLTLEKVRSIVAGPFALGGSREERREAVALEMGPDTFFLSTTCRDVVAELVPKLSLIEESVDVLELRADLLQRDGGSESDGDGDGDAPPSAEYVLRQVAALRAATDMPILFTVRSRASAAPSPTTRRPSRPSPRRPPAGVEWLDVEACWGVEWWKWKRERQQQQQQQQQQQ